MNGLIDAYGALFQPRPSCARWLTKVAGKGLGGEFADASAPPLGAAAVTIPDQAAGQHGHDEQHADDSGVVVVG